MKRSSISRQRQTGSRLATCCGLAATLFYATSVKEVAHATDTLNQIALPHLNAIILQPSGTTGQQTGQQSISAEGLSLTQAPSLYKTLLPYIGKPLTFKEIHELTGIIAIYFKKHDRAFISIDVPEQRVHAGILHIDVMEYRLGKITVHGNTWVPDWQIRRDSNLSSNQTMALTALQTDLDWLNLNPFHTVDLIYRPGDTPGTTDVDLHTSDRFPLYGYAAVNNQADRTLGRFNWYVGASWGNAFGLGHLLTYQFNRTMFGRFNNHSASWTIPLIGHNALQIFGNYALAYPISNTPNLKNRGRSGQVSLRWLHMINHIAIGRNFGIDGMFQTGFDWKTTNSDQFYNQTPIVVSNADTDQFVFGYTGSIQDPLGQIQINNQLFYGPGSLTHYDDRQHYNNIFPKASPNYVYDRIMLTRNQSLPYGWSSTTKVTLQRATKNLLYSEQLMLGGMGNARGYFANTSFGSNGNAFSQEFYAPSFSFSNLTHLPFPNSTSKIGFFWDWSENWQVRHVGTGSKRATLSSIGIDVTSSLNRYLSITFDSGARLRRIHTNALADRRGIFCDFQVVAGF